MNKLVKLASLGLLTGLAQISTAGENLWIYTTGTDTRPEGSWELKLKDISRFDKDGDDYSFHDIRPEIEYGITDRLTVGAAILIFSHDYDIPDGKETYDPVVGSYSSTQYAGFELNTKYNVLSPYKDFMGLSLGFAYEYRDNYRLDGAEIQQHSFVPILYLQKNFLDDTLVWAFKGKFEFEFREGPGVREEEFAPDLATGISYRIAPKWFIGWEARWQSDYLEPEEDGKPKPRHASDLNSLSSFKIGDQFQWGLYTGPTLHYAEEKWWGTVGLLRLVDSGGDSGSNGAVEETGKAWDEHEKWHLGITFGWEF